MKKHHKQHITYGIILVLVVASLLLAGNYYVNQLKQDYNSQIISLSQELTKTRQDMVDADAMSQEQINSLNGKIALLEQDISSLQSSTQKLDTYYRILDDTLYERGIQLENLQTSTEQQFGELDQQLNDLVVESESFSSVISDVIDSVVSIHTDLGQGSGAIISSDGLVVTNYHVIQGARTAAVYTYDGDSYSVQPLGYDVGNDIALLQLNTNETFPAFDFGNSDKLSAGQKVVALGNPAGLSFTATEGIISSPSRLANGQYFIQTDVTLNPGNSGGPLINSKGDLIGIVDWKVAGYEGLGFAIPSNRVDDIVDNILD